MMEEQGSYQGVTYASTGFGKWRLDVFWENREFSWNKTKTTTRASKTVESVEGLTRTKRKMPISKIENNSRRGFRGSLHWASRVLSRRRRGTATRFPRCYFCRLGKRCRAPGSRPRRGVSGEVRWIGEGWRDFWIWTWIDLPEAEWADPGRLRRAGRAS